LSQILAFFGRLPIFVSTGKTDCFGQVIHNPIVKRLSTPFQVFLIFKNKKLYRKAGPIGGAPDPFEPAYRATVSAPGAMETPV
jgi:hypothetical protein